MSYMDVYKQSCDKQNTSDEKLDRKALCRYGSTIMSTKAKTFKWHNFMSSNRGSNDQAFRTVSIISGAQKY